MHTKIRHLAMEALRPHWVWSVVPTLEVLPVARQLMDLRFTAVQKSANPDLIIRTSAEVIFVCLSLWRTLAFLFLAAVYKFSYLLTYL